MKIKTNSKDVKPGDIFIALNGLVRDGHDYIEDAIKNGASKIIAERGDYKVDTLLVSDTKKYLIDYLDNNYKDQIESLKIIGITGTNGKTTSCFLIYQMLNKMNIPCAYIGTIGFYLKDEVFNLDNTTPDVLELYQLLLKCYQADIKYVVMEVSSHALSLNRLGKIKLDYGIFTNLTVDHLDYHNNLEEYAKCKQKLFYMIKDNGVAIVNNDDNYSEMMKIYPKTITYGFKESDYQIIKYQMNQNKTKFNFKYKDQIYNVNTIIVGQYNVYNLLTMIITLHQEGFNLEDIINKILVLKAPPGRMDTVNYKNNKVIIDYAHTPDAIFNVLNAVKQFSKGNIYSIIGCGGNRDKTKRSRMTFYATELSNFVIITSDNPRNEDPYEIVKDMLDNNVKDNYKVIIDRKQAIKWGISLLDNNDILVILGKGHENYQIIGDNKLYHNDKEYVLKLCK